MQFIFKVQSEPYLEYVNFHDFKRTGHVAEVDTIYHKGGHARRFSLPWAPRNEWLSDHLLLINANDILVLNITTYSLFVYSYLFFSESFQIARPVLSLQQLSKASREKSYFTVEENSVYVIGPELNLMSQHFY